MALRQAARILHTGMGSLQAQRQACFRHVSDEVPSPVSSDITKESSSKGPEWTEVVDTKTGRTYYWNQKTGETTELGEPMPKTRFRSSSEEHDEAYEGASSLPQGWREPVEPDRTFYYATLGVGIGILAGWASQFMH